MTGITATRGLHEDFFADIDMAASSLVDYPFPMRVAVPRGRSPRHEMFQFTREMGSGMLSDLLAGRPLVSPGRTAPVHLLFMFPERHMEPWEQQCFNLLLAANPSHRLFACVDVVTQSPLIVGDYVREMMRIITWPDEEAANRVAADQANTLVRQALARSREYRRKVEG